MRRVVQLNVTANWGSTGKIAEGIGVAARRRGWESAIAYGRYVNPSESDLIRVGGKADVYAHYALHRLFDAEGLGSRGATRRLIRQLDALNPSVVHLHNIHDHWLNYPLLFGYLGRISCPVVWTFHDCWAFSGGCAHFVEAGCCKWQEECGDCPVSHNLVDRSRRNFRLKRELISALGDRLTIVSVSRWLDSLVEQSVFGHLRHLHIYNGIDTEGFRPTDTAGVDAKYGLTGKRVLLGVSSVWSELKGAKDYFALSRLLPADYRVVLVGFDPQRHPDLPRNIVGIPRTDNITELAALYSRAEVVLSLSKAETFGLTLVEGLACGTPSVGYASTAIKEIITADTGIAVAPGDVSAVRDAVMLISTGEKVFGSEVCRRKAVECFNRDVQFDKYIDLYDSLL